MIIAIQTLATVPIPEALSDYFSSSFIEIYLTNKYCVYVRCTIGSFHICTHYKIIITIKLVDTYIIQLPSSLFLVWWEHIRSSLLANVKCYNELLLAIVTLLYFTSLELLILHYWNFVPFDQLPIFHSPISWQPHSIPCFYGFDFFTIIFLKAKMPSYSF